MSLRYIVLLARTVGLLLRYDFEKEVLVKEGSVGLVCLERLVFHYEEDGLSSI